MAGTLRVVIAIGLIVTCVGRAAAQTPSGPARFPPRVFALSATDIYGWRVAHVNAERQESNARARRDSVTPSLYLFSGAWAPLHRSTGWYERMLLYGGPVDAVTTLLVSEFPGPSAAARAYTTVTRGLPLKRLSIGTHAGAWQPRAGTASGPGGKGDPFGTFVDYLQYGSVLAEISSDVTAPRKTPLVDPGPSIARKLVARVRVASIPVVSSTSLVSGLRLFISIPDHVYPRDALAQVTVEITNVTANEFELLADPAGSLTNAIHIRELDDTGQVVPMPASFEDYLLPEPPGPPIPLTLGPHDTLRLHPTIILWTDHLQIEARCFYGMSCDEITGTPIAVPVADAPPPTVDLLDSDGQPLALVHVTAGFRGRLLYRSSIQCTPTGPVPPNIIPLVRDEIPAYAELDHTWAHTTGILLSPPPCPDDHGPARLTDWRLIAGWPGYPVGVADYHAPTAPQSTVEEAAGATGSAREQRGPS